MHPEVVVIGKAGLFVYERTGQTAALAILGPGQKAAKAYRYANLIAAAI